MTFFKILPYLLIVSSILINAEPIGKRQILLNGLSGCADDTPMQRIEPVPAHLPAPLPAPVAPLFNYEIPYEAMSLPVVPPAPLPVPAPLPLEPAFPPRPIVVPELKSDDCNHTPVLPAPLPAPVPAPLPELPPLAPLPPTPPFKQIQEPIIYETPIFSSVPVPEVKSADCNPAPLVPAPAPIPVPAPLPELPPLAPLPPTPPFKQILPEPIVHETPIFSSVPIPEVKSDDCNPAPFVPVPAPLPAPAPLPELPPLAPLPPMPLFKPEPIPETPVSPPAPVPAFLPPQQPALFPLPPPPPLKITPESPKDDCIHEAPVYSAPAPLPVPAPLPAPAPAPVLLPPPYLAQPLAPGAYPPHQFVISDSDCKNDLTGEVIQAPVRYGAITRNYLPIRL